jgi:hypothetical protein
MHDSPGIYHHDMNNNDDYIIWFIFPSLMDSDSKPLRVSLCNMTMWAPGYEVLY